MASRLDKQMKHEMETEGLSFTCRKEGKLLILRTTVTCGSSRPFPTATSNVKAYELNPTIL